MKLVKYINVDGNGKPVGEVYVNPDYIKYIKEGGLPNTTRIYLIGDDDSNMDMLLVKKRFHETALELLQVP